MELIGINHTRDSSQGYKVKIGTNWMSEHLEDASYHVSYDYILSHNQTDVKPTSRAAGVILIP